jgi:hypothetical protein
LAKDIELDQSLGPQLFPEETAAEAVARIVAANPGKHGVTVAEREHRMIEQARRIADETKAFFEAPDECAHEWPDDATADSTCAKCGVTLEAWANS